MTTLPLPHPVPRHLHPSVGSLPVEGQRTAGPTFADQLANDRATVVVFLRHHG